MKTSLMAISLALILSASHAKAEVNVGYTLEFLVMDAKFIIQGEVMAVNHQERASHCQLVVSQTMKGTVPDTFWVTLNHTRKGDQQLNSGTKILLFGQIDQSLKEPIAPLLQLSNLQKAWFSTEGNTIAYTGKSEVLKSYDEVLNYTKTFLKKQDEYTNAVVQIIAEGEADQILYMGSGNYLILPRKKEK